MNRAGRLPERGHPGGDGNGGSGQRQSGLRGSAPHHRHARDARAEDDAGGESAEMSSEVGPLRGAEEREQRLAGAERDPRAPPVLGHRDERVSGAEHGGGGADGDELPPHEGGGSDRASRPGEDPYEEG